MLTFCRLPGLLLLLLAALRLPAGAQIIVPEAPPAAERAQTFHDSHFGVSFQVPAGWSLVRRDWQVSSFHLDARSAAANAKVRGVASIQFNPYPYSTFSGARLYFSVQPRSGEAACAAQATGQEDDLHTRILAPLMWQRDVQDDVQDIGGMNFVHGHDESGKVCVEARDEVYTAFRKGSCYRFDLAMNTFCAVSSGAVDLTQAELQTIDQRMADILSTVQLAWEKAGPHPVPAPQVPLEPTGRTPGQHVASAAFGGGLKGRRHPSAASPVPRAEIFRAKGKQG